MYRRSQGAPVLNRLGAPSIPGDQTLDEGAGRRFTEKRASCTGRSGTKSFCSLVGVALTAVLTCLLLGPGAVAAQQSSELAGVLQDLPEGSRVRLDLGKQSAPAVGGLVNWNESNLVLVSAGKETAHPLGNIRRLWIDDGHHGSQGARNGALVGGGIGFVLGVVGRVTSFGGGESDLDFDALGTGAIVALPGALIGAGIGYLHGRQQTDWRLRFEARDGRVGLRAEVPLP